MKIQIVPIDAIYVPTQRRLTLDPKKVESLAEAILAAGLEEPILVRPDGARFVLIEGLHRLEACRSLGERTIRAYYVQARRH